MRSPRPAAGVSRGELWTGLTHQIESPIRWICAPVLWPAVSSRENETVRDWMCRRAGAESTQRCARQRHAIAVHAPGELGARCGSGTEGERLECDEEEVDTFHDAASSLGEDLHEGLAPEDTLIWAADCESSIQESVGNWMEFGSRPVLKQQQPTWQLRNVVGCFLLDTQVTLHADVGQTLQLETARLPLSDAEGGASRGTDLLFAAARPRQEDPARHLDSPAGPIHGPRHGDNCVGDVSTSSPTFSPGARFQMVRMSWIDNTSPDSEQSPGDAAQMPHLIAQLVTPRSRSDCCCCEEDPMTLATSTPSDVATTLFRINRFEVGADQGSESPSEVATGFFRLNRFLEGEDGGASCESGERCLSPKDEHHASQQHYAANARDSCYQSGECDEQVSITSTCRVPPAGSHSNGTSASEYESGLEDNDEDVEQDGEEHQQQVIVTPACSSVEEHSQCRAVRVPPRPAKGRHFQEHLAKCELEALMQFGNRQRSVCHEKRRALKTPPAEAPPSCRRSLFFSLPHSSEPHSSES